MPRRHLGRAALKLRLYVAGTAPNSTLALANIREICGVHFADGHDIEVVDLLVHAERGLLDGIIVTPTLIRVWPGTTHRLIGTLSDTQQVVRTLGSR